MTLIALASVKGSPGVTTAATALAASWPAGRRVLLVEADPFGGDLAPRYGVAPTGGLSSLFAAARRTLQPSDVWDHVDHLPGGLPVLFGLGGMHQAVANEKAWPIVADVLGALDADVVIDVGRLLPNLAGGVREVLARADALVVLCPSTLEAIVHLREALPSLTAELRGRSFSSSPPERPSSRRPTSDAPWRSRCFRPYPTTRGQQPRLANRRSVKRLERTRLLRWAADTLGALGIDATPPVESEESPMSAEQTEADPSATTTTDPVETHEPDESPDGTRPEGQLAGAAPSTTREAV